MGYENNFDKISEQAEKNPDVHYLTGTHHSEAIEKSGLDNIESHSSLDTANVMGHIERFKGKTDQIAETKLQLVDHQDSLNDIGMDDHLGLPLFSLAISGARQLSLIENGDISIAEAAGNTVLKTGIKWGAAKGAGMAGAKLGALAGGPVGAIIGGVLGAIGGSCLGGTVFVAWKSDSVYKGYGSFLRRVERISDVACGDLRNKKQQINRFQDDIAEWKSNHWFQVIWPSKEYVIRIETSEFLVSQHSTIQSQLSNIQDHTTGVVEIRRKCNDAGFFKRLFDDQKEMERLALDKSQSVLKIIMNTDVVRVDLIRQIADELKNQKEFIEREKRKIA